MLITSWYGFADVREGKDWYSKIRVIRIQWDLKIIRVTRKFGIRGEKYIGFGQFDQKICSDYADFTVQ